jgi:hypothetical protein
MGSSLATAAEERELARERGDAAVEALKRLISQEVHMQVAESGQRCFRFEH